MKKIIFLICLLFIAGTIEAFQINQSNNKLTTTTYFVDNTSHSIYSSSSSTGLAWTLSPLNEVTLLTTTIKGGDMGSDGSLVIETLFEYLNSSNSKAIRQRLGGTLFNTASYTTTSSHLLHSTLRNRNSNSQIGSALGLNNPFSSAVGDVFYSSINTAIDNQLVISSSTTTEAGKPAQLCSAVSSTITSTVTCSAFNHGYTAGQYIHVTGATPTFYNANPVQIVSVPTASTVVYLISSGMSTTTTVQPSLYRYSPITLESCHIQISR